MTPATGARLNHHEILASLGVRGKPGVLKLYD
jgi:hypothetical protein